MVEVKKMSIFLTICAMYARPLWRFIRLRFKNYGIFTIFNLPICVIEVKKIDGFCNFEDWYYWCAKINGFFDSEMKPRYGVVRNLLFIKLFLEMIMWFTRRSRNHIITGSILIWFVIIPIRNSHFLNIKIIALIRTL